MRVAWHCTNVRSVAWERCKWRFCLSDLSSFVRLVCESCGASIYFCIVEHRRVRWRIAVYCEVCFGESSFLLSRDGGTVIYELLSCWQLCARACGALCRSALTPSVFPLSRVRHGPVVLTPFRRSSVFSCFAFGQSYHGYSLHCVTVWVCLYVIFVGMYRSTYDSVELSLGACVGHFTYQSINQSINQRSIRVTKVTNVTARPLLQCS